MTDNHQENVSAYTALDWYDGPLLEIARVDFANHDSMVQVRSLCSVHKIEQPPAGSSAGQSAAMNPGHEPSSG